MLYDRKERVLSQKLETSVFIYSKSISELGQRPQVTKYIQRAYGMRGAHQRCEAPGLAWPIHMGGDTENGDKVLPTSGKQQVACIDVCTKDRLLGHGSIDSRSDTTDKVSIVSYSYLYKLFFSLKLHKITKLTM